MIPGFALHPHPALHHLQLVTARKKRGCAYSDKLGRNTGFKLKMKTLPQGRAHNVWWLNVRSAAVSLQQEQGQGRPDKSKT